MDPHPIPVRNFVAACDLVLQRAQRISSLICHPLISTLQLQGALIAVLLAVAWSWAAVVRLGEMRRQQAACAAPTQQLSCSAPGCTPGASSSDLEQASGLPLPPATVILPVTGCSANSQANWLAALGLRYPAELQFLFVVRSKADAAHDAVLALLAGDGSSRQVPQHKARVVVAGPATSCSQKLHNILEGLAAAAPDSKFALCLDDDIQAHPSFMERTVQQLQADPSLFMATGYPLDIPAPGSSLLTYCVLAYHLPLLAAFSTRQRIQFVWGGCMVMPLGPLRDDRYGIVKAWAGGGYSDDLIVAAKCAEHKLQVLCQPHAVFPQRLDPCFSWRHYWNYLRRQLFVMDTWAGDTNRRINHTMMVAHSYLSWAFTVPATTASLRLLLWVVQLLLLPTQQVYDGPGTSWDWLGLFGEKGCSLSMVSTLLFWVGLLSAAGALRWMTGVLLDLFTQQLPAADDLDLQCFSWGKVWLGMYVNNALLPVCMLYTYLQPAVEWAGITYWKRNGSITYVQHTSAPQCRPSRRE